MAGWRGCANSRRPFANIVDLAVDRSVDFVLSLATSSTVTGPLSTPDYI